MQALLTVILPVFVVIGMGYLAVWRGVFSESGVDGLMKFTQNFAVPALLFRAISTLDLGQEFELGLLISFYAPAAICFALGIAGARWLFHRPWPDSIAIGFGALFSNTVLLGLPIMERAYGADALTANYAIIAIHSPFCYALGITAMEVTRAKGQSIRQIAPNVLRAMFHNPLVIGITAGFAVNLSGLGLPVFVTDGFDLLVRAALPAALFGLGGVLYQYRPEGDAMTITMVVVISLILHPSLAYGFAQFFALDEAQLRSLIVTASMAPGLNVYIFANLYGVGKRVAASSVLVATALCIVTTWVWLEILP